MIRRGIGVQSYVSAGGFDADAQAVITTIESTGVTLTATQKTACNTLVTDLKGYGIWTKFKAVYGFLGGTAGAHKWNWKNPADTDAAFRLVFAGGITHSSTGVLWNGTNGYGDTFITPVTNFNSFNWHLSFYSRTNNTIDASDMGIRQAADGRKDILFYGNNASIMGGFNSDPRNFISASTTNSQGFYSLQRQSISSGSMFKNGVSLGSRSNLSNYTMDATGKILLGAIGNPISPNFYSSRQMAFASIGDGLTDTEAANLYAAVQAYQTTLSRNV